MHMIIDEQVITSRIAAERERDNAVLSNVSIAGSAYQFEKREFCPDFSIVLPVNFEQLAPDNLVAKYPNVNRPEVVLSNAEATVNIAFKCMPAAMRDMDSRLAEYIAVIKRMHPGYVLFSKDVVNLNSGIKAACYDFRGIALDSDIYCLNFFADLPDAELFGWFSCPIDQKENWESVALMMIKTVTPIS